MLLYHYTSLIALERIQIEGLTRGEVPLSERRVLNAVSLTSDPSPAGHGLDHGGHVVTLKEAALFASKGFNIPAGTVYVDKRAVRVTVKVLSTDPALKAWRPWARRHCEEGYADHLEKAAGYGGRKAKTWYLYFGIISPAAFVDIKVLRTAPQA